MSRSKAGTFKQGIETILEFVEYSSGLSATIAETNMINVAQNADGKSLKFDATDVSEVLQRADSEGKSFLQVNFFNGKKMLLTDSLVGFKPTETVGLDMTRLPKVVTTPDLKSVFDAIEDSLSADIIHSAEVEILKKVYLSILLGAENIGFNLFEEKQQFFSLVTTSTQAAA